ncbi:MAG: hypothetical protein ACYC00_00155 [Eubacteriales bacterium]
MLIKCNIKKPALLCIVFIFTSCLLGCGIDADKKDIYDNDIYIAQEGDIFSFYNRVGEEDEKQIDIKYSGFYGAQTIWVIQTEENSEINLSFHSIVKSGKFKIVLITPEQDLISITEQDNNGTFKINVAPGKYKIKIIGKNASGNLQIGLCENKSNKVFLQDNKL